ncbi:MAG: ribonuclease Z [Candidatus Eiseniibacteriota bacterium]|nr:MAG: ribonuclease Z [Candidatus Eisenbacteria bacterium]
MDTRLVALGTNGFIPTFGRQTMSFLLLTPEEAILFDAGTGVARLPEPHIAELVRPYERLNIVLSHYHLDHTVGLSYLPGIWTEKPVSLFAPGEPLVEADAKQAVGKLLSPPLFPLTIDCFPSRVQLTPIEKESLSIGPHRLEVRSQTHPGGSIGMRLDDSFAYITDTAVRPETTELVQGVSLLLHEVWLTDQEAEDDPRAVSMHSFAGGVAVVAETAKVGKLMPVHHHPAKSAEQLSEIMKLLEACGSTPVVFPEEGKVYSVD